MSLNLTQFDYVSMSDIAYALVLYLGICKDLGEDFYTFPNRNAKQVLMEYGSIKGRKMIDAILDPVIKEGSLSEIDWSVHTLDSAYRLVKKIVEEHYPELKKITILDFTKFDYVSMKDINYALVLYLGIDEKFYTFPSRNDEQILKKFGKIKGQKMIDEVLYPLAKEANLLEIDWSVHTLDSAYHLAKKIMKERYPALSERAIEALANDCAWDWK